MSAPELSITTTAKIELNAVLPTVVPARDDERSPCGKATGTVLVLFERVTRQMGESKPYFYFTDAQGHVWHRAAGEVGTDQEFYKLRPRSTPF